MLPLISLVIPAYNEQANIPELAKRLRSVFKTLPSYRFEVIVVENGSRDQTLNQLLAVRKIDRRFKILQLARNFGADPAIAAGLRFCRGHAAIIMMADLQDPPQLIPKFLNYWRQGYQIVYGLIKQRQGTSWLRDFNSRLFYKVINWLTQGLFPENASDFRLIDQSVYQTINSMPEHNQFMRGLIMWTGFKSIGVKFVRPPRFAGKSKANFRTVLQVALNGIFSFSYFPLKLVTGLGLLLSITAFTMIVIQLALYAIYGRIQPGQNTLVVLLSFFFGMLFLILGIIGEYLARIYDEVKNRPHFVVKHKIGW